MDGAAENQLVINGAQTSAKKIAAKFGEQVTCATPTSERITAGFVDSVLTVHSNMFQKNLKSSPVLQPGGQACLVPEPKQTHTHNTQTHCIRNIA